MIQLLAKPIVDSAIEKLKKDCQVFKSKGITPNLQVVLVGNNDASIVYTRNKKKFCERFGANCDINHLSETTTKEELIKLLSDLAEDKAVHGLFVQLPLPKHLSDLDIAKYIPASKDVDGFHPQNLFHLLEGKCLEKSLIPCTPQGIITMLDFNQIEISGKDVVIIGRSLIVGKPLALLFTSRDATVTLCHSKTKNLEEKCKRADIIVAAIGQSEFLNQNFINENRNQVLIDVGINRNKENSLCGDIDFKSIEGKVMAATPVPGGVGPMTILCLAQNLLKAAKLQTSS